MIKRIGIIAAVLLVILQGCAPQPEQPQTPTAALPTLEAQAPGAGGVTIGHRTKTSGCISANGLPDPACTPGAIQASVTMDPLCKPDFATPASPLPQELQDQVFAEYGITSPAPGAYEIDHLIPVELGGSNDIANLWPQPAEPRPGFQEKNKVESYMHDQACAGWMTLSQAQDEMAKNWVSILPKVP